MCIIRRSFATRNVAKTTSRLRIPIDDTEICDKIERNLLHEETTIFTYIIEETAFPS